MGRASMTNVDIGGRIKQFVVLIVITTIGMIISVAFLGGGSHKPRNASTEQIKEAQPLPSQASFK